MLKKLLGLSIIRKAEGLQTLCYGKGMMKIY